MGSSSGADQSKNRLGEAAEQLHLHVDRVCLGAMETQHRSADQAMLASARQSLQIVRDTASWIEAPAIVEAAMLVDEGFELVRIEDSGSASYLGHLVTSIAADLVRVVQATVDEADPEPFLVHARDTVQLLSRLKNESLVEVDITNAEQVARFFESVDGSSEQTDESDHRPSGNAAVPSHERTTRLSVLYEALRMASTSPSPEERSGDDEEETPPLRGTS